MVQRESVTILNFRVKLRSLLALNSQQHEQLLSNRESHLETNAYMKLVHFLLHTMRDRFF